MNRTDRAVVALAVTAGALAVAATAFAGGVAGGVAAESTATPPTYVDSDVTTDTTWTAAEGPYRVTADVTIEAGATLTIEPGTTVQAAEDVTITVEGSLVAAGTRSSPVVFTTARPSPQPGSWEELRYAGGEDSLLRLANATVEYGRTAINVTTAEGRIEVVDSTVRAHVRAGIEAFDRTGVPSIRVVDSRFAEMGVAGLLFRTHGTNPYLDSVSDVTVRGTTFANTGAYGVVVRARQVRSVAVAGSTVSGFRAAGVSVVTERRNTRETSSETRGVTNLDVRDNRIFEGGGHGVVVAGGHHQDVDVAGNDVRGVDGTGIRVARAVDLDDVAVTGNVVADAATGVYVSNRRTSGPIFQVSLTVAGNALRGNDRHGLRVDTEYVTVERLHVRGNTFAGNGRDGALLTTPRFSNTVVADNVARDNAGTGVELAGNSVRDATVSGNRLVDNGAGGLRLSAGGAMSGVTVARNDAFDNAGVGIEVAHARVGDRRLVLENNTVVANTVGVRVAGPTPTLLANNSVAYNTRGSASNASDGGLGPATGVVVEDARSNVTLRFNDVYGHVVGLWSDTDGTVHAERNYWGAASGPFHATVNPDGTGNAVETATGKAAVVPFAESRFGPRFERPTAALAANRTTVAPNGSVRLSASGSTDDGLVRTYHFRVDGEVLAGRESPVLVRSFAANGTHEVAVVVEDEFGIESATAAAVTVEVVPGHRTTTGSTATTAQPDNGTTTGPPGEDSGGGTSLAAALLSLPGLLGALPFGLGVLLGAFGVFRSLQGRDPPTSGLAVHALAVGGALVWTTAGLLGSGPLLTLGLGTGGAWTGLSGALYVVAIR